MTNLSPVSPDETVSHEPSHPDLHFLQRYMFWSARLSESVKSNSLLVRAFDCDAEGCGLKPCSEID